MPEQITINLQTLIAWCAFIGVLGGAIVYIKKGAGPILAPFRRVENKVKSHEQYLHNDKEKLEEHDKAIKEISEDNKVICKALLLLMEHAVTGNSVEKLKKGKQELQEYLINR